MLKEALRGPFGEVNRTRFRKFVLQRPIERMLCQRPSAD